LGSEDVIGRAKAQLVQKICAHAPQAAIGSYKKGVIISGGNRRDIVGYNQPGSIGANDAEAVAQLAMRVAPHSPKAAIRLQKNTVENSGGNFRNGRGLGSNGRQQQDEPAKNPNSIKGGAMRNPQGV